MNRLNELLSPLNIELSTKQLDQFQKYYEILIEWNKVMNLTGITEFDDVLRKHFVDSLSIIRVLEFQNINSVIDIGTGAGFPGIPLKIAFPHLDIVLLDSLNKRLKFLNHVIDELDLIGIRTIHGRAEDFAKQKDYREKFDLCVSRAVANLSTLSEYCIPYVKINGMFASYKSGDIDDELISCHNAVKILGGNIINVDKFELSGSDDGRSFVCIKKIKSTPKKYPRKPGLPSKEPLI